MLREAIDIWVEVESRSMLVGINDLDTEGVFQWYDGSGNPCLRIEVVRS